MINVFILDDCIWDGLGINVKLYMDNLCELENREVVC